MRQIQSTIEIKKNEHEKGMLEGCKVVAFNPR